MDLAWFFILLGLGLVSIIISFKAREKTLFLTLATIFFLVLGLALFTQPITTAMTTAGFTYATEQICNTTNVNLSDCTYNNTSVPATTTYQAISIPSPLNQALALILIGFGLFVGFKAALTASQPNPKN
jgi:hypothetical protein